MGKVFKSYDLLTKKSKVNNLYGYPTYDVLSSNSYFRDSFSLDVNSYRLGTKYKLFIGDYSSLTSLLITLMKLVGPIHIISQVIELYELIQ
jgi:hypothetical protein